jgi:hypothetical protein
VGAMGPCAHGAMGPMVSWPPPWAHGTHAAHWAQKPMGPMSPWVHLADGAHGARGPMGSMGPWAHGTHGPTGSTGPMSPCAPPAPWVHRPMGRLSPWSPWGPWSSWAHGSMGLMVAFLFCKAHAIIWVATCTGFMVRWGLVVKPPLAGVIVSCGV